MTVAITFLSLVNLKQILQEAAIGGCCDEGSASKLVLSAYGACCALDASPATTTTGLAMSDAPLEARNQDLFTSNIIVAAVFVSPPSG